MQEVLKSKLHHFLKQNNPEILLQLEENQTVDEYLTVKVNAIADFLRELQEANKPAYITFLGHETHIIPCCSISFFKDKISFVKLSASSAK